MTGFALGIAPIAARPPTPPKENTAKASPRNGFGTTTKGPVLLDTPDESPSSSAEYFKDSTGKAQKRVGFTLLGTQYHRFPIGGLESDSDGQIRQLPRSRDCKSSKSILKVCTDNAGYPSSNELLACENTNLPAMLRSTTQHLASTSRCSRLDAYSTLLACLSAYDEVPEAPEFAEKVGEVTGYIRRDVTAKNEGDGSLDIQLATQALKLVTILLCSSKLAAMFPEDFCSFILERSITSLEDEASPKILVSHYMHLLEKQKFASKYMTFDRVNRLISALDNVTARVKGNRVVGHRLMIYQRLLGQAKPLMVSRVGSWIDHLVSAMLSTIKDIRARAIAFGVDASLQLGTTSSVSQACLEMFNRASADRRKVVDFLSSRLIEMANSKEDGIHVPQIWSVVIMFLRSRRRQLEGWEHLKAWLIVIQRCFNSSDGQTKLQANIAWNRLIFAVDLDTATSTSMAKMLRQPIVSQLERRSSEKNSKLAKQVARSSYCTLLYYALRPTATYAQLDQYWDLYICQILPSCFTASKNDTNHACDILSALFSGNGKSKVWEENRANNGLVSPADLPCLDSKWIRLRTARIMHVFDKMFDTADWQLYKDGDAPVVLAWRSFTLALGNAGGKEVKVSMDAMHAVAHIINEIKHILERSNSRLARERNDQLMDITSQTAQSETFEKIRILINEAVAKVGYIPFLERRLIQTSQNSFEAADTPSSRSSRDSGSLNSPVVHLLNLLLRNVQQTPIATSYIDVLKTVLNISLNSTTSRRTQLGILRNLGRLITLDSVHQKEASITFWMLLAESTSSTLEHPQQDETHNDSPQYPGHEFRDAVKILELGIQLRCNRNRSMWHKLHRDIINALREGVGDEAIGPVVLEPLAAFISKDEKTCDDFVLAAATLMLEAMYWPQSPHLMERAHHRLWGVTHVAPRTPQDPFDKLYSMAGVLLSNSYASLELLSSATVARFFSATSKMIVSCPPEYISMVLFRIQQGLAPWIEDAKGILSPRLSSPFRAPYAEVNKLWIKGVNSVKRSVVFDTRFLFNIQELVIAGFRSRHKSVVNESIVIWNTTFGEQGTLEYPEALRPIFRKLKSMTDLKLPNFPDLNGEEVMSSPLHFVNSQDEEEMQLEPGASSIRPTLSFGPLQRIAESIKAVSPSPDSRKGVTFQGSPSARRGVKTTPTGRLRHDDSQIRFAAIESSPFQPEAVESQYLTDRQKEVKERQGREAAAMFPEIRSSPRSTGRPTDFTLPKLVFNYAQNSGPKPAIDEDTSPIYPPDALMNEYLGSSPTPTLKRSREWRSGDSPPSSPLISSYLQSNRLADAPLALEDQVPVQVLEKAEEHPGDPFADENPPRTEGHHSSHREFDSAVVDAPMTASDQEEASKLQAPQLAVDAHPMSGVDLLVDPPLVPSLLEPSSDDHNQTSDVMNSFQSECSSHFSVEDEQVTAQLITEMERASSQQSAEQEKRVQSAREAIKKRKRTTDSPNKNKKIKRMAASLDSQMNAEVPGTGETVADCVMIKVGEVAHSRPVLLQQVKKERSASPSIFTSIRAIEETPGAKKTPVDLSRLLGANQSSDQRQDTPKMATKLIGRPYGFRNRPAKGDEAEKDQHNALRKSTRISERLSGSTSSSPQMTLATSQEATKGEQWLALGRTPRRSMFRWLQRSSAEREDLGSLRPTAPAANGGTAEAIEEESRVQGSQGLDLSPADRDLEHPITIRNEDGDFVAEQGEGEATAEGRGGFEGEGKGEEATAQGMLERFHSVLDNIKRITFGPEEERAMVGMLFECVKEVHEAGRRHISM